MTQDQLKKILSYDPETGLFHWKIKPSKRFAKGMQAGSLGDGYIRIHTNGRQYGAHRLAWLYVHGVEPEHQIDHINGNPSDNRIVNLRQATQMENAQNIRKPQKNNSHGNLGVTYDPKKKLWRTRISINGTRKYIGKFKTQEQAAQAYLEAKRSMHPFNTL
jgi:hypothetical protein